MTITTRAAKLLEGIEVQRRTSISAEHKHQLDMFDAAIADTATEGNISPEGAELLLAMADECIDHALHCARWLADQLGQTQKHLTPKAYQALLRPANERGSTLLTTCEGNLVYWRQLDDGIYEEISFTPTNYPAFGRRVLPISEEDLAQHIKKACAGWHCRRINIAGVVVDETILADEPSIQGSM